MFTYFEYPHVVTKSEIDELDHAGNFHYIKWMQEAAVAHSTANGWSARRYIELGAGWVVRSHNVTYLKPAFEGDSIIVRTWVSNIKPVTSLRHYEILDDRPKPRQIGRLSTIGNKNPPGFQKKCLPVLR